MTRRRIAPLLPLLLVLAACPRDVDFGPLGRADDPSTLLSIEGRRRATLHSAAGEGKLTLEGPDGSGTLSAALGAEEPGRLWVETRDLLGNPRGLVACDGARCTLWEPDAGRYIEGPATAATLGRLLPIALPPELLVVLLLGEPPVLDADVADFRVDEAEGHYVLELAAGARRQTLRFETATRRLVVVETAGPQAWRATLEDPDEAGHPETIRLETERGTRTLEVRWKARVRNARSAPGDWSFPPPPGAIVERLP